MKTLKGKSRKGGGWRESSTESKDEPGVGGFQESHALSL